MLRCLGQYRIFQPRLLRFVWTAVAIVLCCRGGAVAQTLSEPEALPTQFVDCADDASGHEVASRHLRTQDFMAANGAKAFGSVQAEFHGGCEHHTMLYVAQPGSNYRLVWQQDTEHDPFGDLDGSGVEQVRWSPSGRRVLFQLFQWTSGSDTDGAQKYLVVSTGETQAHPIPVAEHVFRLFAHDCAAHVTSVEWIDDDRVELLVMPYLAADEDGTPDGTPSCVKENTAVSLNVETFAAELLPKRSRLARR
jgi:hypothetical protein